MSVITEKENSTWFSTTLSPEIRAAICQRAAEGFWIVALAVDGSREIRTQVIPMPRKGRQRRAIVEVTVGWIRQQFPVSYAVWVLSAGGDPFELHPADVGNEEFERTATT